MFFAITKHVTVEAEPNITKIATSSSFLNPKRIANGRKIAQKPISLKNAAIQAGFI